MVYLLLVLLALVMAPFFYQLVQKLEKSFAVLEAMLFFLSAGLVVVHILPDAWSHAGWWALVGFGLAWVLPWAAEHYLHDHEEQVHLVPIIVSITGLALHGVTDGVALSYASDASSMHINKFGLHYHPLPIAVVLHSFPASIFVYWVLKPKYGTRFAISALAVMGVTTLIGYWSGSEYLQALHSSFQMGVFEGIAAGSLMHLASHRIKH